MLGEYLVIEAMDRLWFHRVVLFAEPSSIQRSLPITESLTCYSSMMSIPEDEEIISRSSTIFLKDDSDGEKETMPMRSSTGLSDTSSRFGSQSSLINDQSRAANLRFSSSSKKLKKSMSCKSFSELEVEEVHGFMDLGFKFSQMQLSPRMMSVLPGLQRLGCHVVDDDDDEVEKDDEIEEDDSRKLSLVRPYLSEAWLIKKPNSPLLNLRVPKIYAADDMKKHLKYWARIVASVVHQES